MKRLMRASTLALSMLALAGCSDERSAIGSDAAAAAAKAARAAYDKEILDWRAGRVQRLTKPDGWLSLVGMHWLEVGNTRVGAAADNGTRLAVGPAHLGVLTLGKDGQLSFHPEVGAEVIIDGQPAAAATALRSDADLNVEPTVVAFNKGDASFIVIKRGGRYALRVRDALSPNRSKFAGIQYFDIDPAFRVSARFNAHPPGTKIGITNVLGMVEPMDNPGTITFTRDGKPYTLEAVDEGDHQLFLMYADRTSGHESYPAARFLYADYPDPRGNTIVDFNKGYSPPCAFTDFATCPLPPTSNRLDLAITAGEKKPVHPAPVVIN